jgi:hypothetical protein
MEKILLISLFIIVFAIIAGLYAFSLAFIVAIKIGFWSAILAGIVYLLIKYRKKDGTNND